MVHARGWFCVMSTLVRENMLMCAVCAAVAIAAAVAVIGTLGGFA